MEQRVRKAVILVAGYGTRFLPATKAMPKEMLPVLDKPGLQYTVEEAVAAGITDIIFVTGRGKRAIEDHFDANAELEESLRLQGKRDLLHSVQRATALANIMYVRQPHPLGTGEAALRAQPAVGNEPFLLLYPDDFFLGTKNNIRLMLDAYEEYQAPIMGVARVPKKDVVKFGIIKGKHIQKNIYEVFSVVEKPSLAAAPSTLASFKGYVLQPDIFRYLKKIKPPSKDGEVWLPDAVALYNKRHSVFACALAGERFDLGSKLGWMQANVAMALRHKEYRSAIRRLVQTHHTP